MPEPAAPVPPVTQQTYPDPSDDDADDGGDDSDDQTSCEYGETHGNDMGLDVEPEAEAEDDPAPWQDPVPADPMAQLLAIAGV